ncbi:MAG: pyrrolysine--tRNA(Pyl) ligase small subunit [Eggerthellaceae bacterium]|jgi:pyrrolysyl-tRNA synthetase-like protein|nr:pyrrolysine--tRNA(Pyl) ligase small subunit [Eggerthellaceae bacterium]MCH4221660.1 pyrrolysine--tRNA(Pyl) ligase small subunit [Eggerthellaceae bacterium]
MPDLSNGEKKTKRYLDKNRSLYDLINKVKLWPSRSGVLHGVKTVTRRGNRIDITTHCGEEFTVWDSRNSRSARWLRNRLVKTPCPRCGVPDWKLEKYNSTVFTTFSKKGR